VAAGIDEELYTYRRSFGNNGRIIMNYTADGTTGQQEVFETTTGVLYNLDNTNLSTLGGDGCTLASDEYAWLTPGAVNDPSKPWYDSMVKVDYSLALDYANSRCYTPEGARRGAGGVSNKIYGWILYKSAIADTYDFTRLDYSNDTSGFEVRCSPLLDSRPTMNLDYRNVGCSSNTMNSGYFLTPHYWGVNTIARLVLKFDYADDSTYLPCRTMNLYTSNIERVSNAQSRSNGTYSIFFWTPQVSVTGPLSLDLATDTTSYRFRGSNTNKAAANYTYCGSEASGTIF
jgi:hypothetical protein